MLPPGLLPRFGVTYEGLKRAVTGRPITNTTSRFGVTYEGLKRRVAADPREDRHSFGVTYEGLKRLGRL